MNNLFYNVGTLVGMTCTVNTQEWDSNTKVYNWKGTRQKWLEGEGIKEIPSDIPIQAVIVDFYWNQIEVVKQNSFSQLSVLEELRLWGNKIHTIERGAWNGLVSLTELRLDGNEIEVLWPGSVTNTDCNRSLT